MTGTVLATVPTAQAVTAAAADCRLTSILSHPGTPGRSCRDNRSDTSDDRDRTEDVGGVIGVVLDFLFD
ncbi:hypothetical protein ACFU9Y_42010 [Streptomyces sp. NPDC057621]|uniref:hypothetical protein n=1 Tax=Streptomyces sp. NPDC057621 TaxID=3346186 RepID=UPI0036CAB4B8